MPHSCCGNSADSGTSASVTGVGGMFGNNPPSTRAFNETLELRKRSETRDALRGGIALQSTRDRVEPEIVQLRNWPAVGLILDCDLQISAADRSENRMRNLGRLELLYHGVLLCCGDGNNDARLRFAEEESANLSFAIFVGTRLGNLSDIHL